MPQDRDSRRRGAVGSSALFLAGTLAGGLAALYVSAHLSAWALPLLWLALAVGLFVAIAFFAHLVPGWLAGATTTLTSSLAFFLSVALSSSVAYHGQHARSIDLVQVIPLIVALGVCTTISLVLWRRRSQLEVVTSDTAAETFSGPPIANVLERIMIYADESMLQRRALLMAACAGALGAGLGWATASHADSAYLIALGILLMFAAVHLTLSMARLFMNGPTLVIGPEGILDNASLVATGCGVLRWDEISRVTAVSEKTPIGMTYHSLRIHLDNKAVVRARQPLWKRLLATVAGGFSPGWVTVYQGLLDESPETLALRITQYGQTYTAAAWRLPDPPDEMPENDGDMWRT